MIDSRIGENHIARYGATDEVQDYLRTLENLRVVPDDQPGEDHHMLARSVWPEYGDLKVNPWNRLRVSYRIHIALTDLQSRFEKRLRVALLMMRGQTVEARRESCSIGGKRGYELYPTLASERAKRTHERYPNLASEMGKRGGSKSGKIGGKRVHEFHPNLAKGMGKIGKRCHELHPNLARENGSRVHELHPNMASENGKKNGQRLVEMGIMPKLLCTRWNINRNKPCTCGQHTF